jgi:SSS family solute:Na+ symporter
LGLFLLGLISKQTKSKEAFIAVLVGVIIIVWLSFSQWIPDSVAYLKPALHKNMIIVIGTLSIFLVGVLMTSLKKVK